MRMHESDLLHTSTTMLRSGSKLENAPELLATSKAVMARPRRSHNVDSEHASPAMYGRTLPNVALLGTGGKGAGGARAAAAALATTQVAFLLRLWAVERACR